jgi:hypothetical protein
VTHGAKKSPAGGLMEVDDVILGAGGRPFIFDARQQIAKAIQDSEKTENGGILKLTRWRTGKTEEVQPEGIDRGIQRSMQARRISGRRAQ